MAGHILRPRDTTILASIGALVSRVILGVIFIMHGWQKLAEWKISGTADAFQGMGVPLPTISATVAAVVEFAGGIALIIGLLAPLVSFLLTIVSVGAFISVSVNQEMFASGWKPEMYLTAALVAGTFAILMAGAGRFSLDSLIFKGKKKAPAPRGNRSSSRA